MLVYANPTVNTLAFGLLPVLLGEFLRIWGVAYAGALTRVTGSVGAPALVISGPFAFVRNPLYLGNMLIYIGIGVMANALAPWLALVVIVYFGLQYLAIAMLEEEFLAREFSDSYAQYRNHVARFLPRIRPYVREDFTKQSASWKEALASERRTFQALAGIALLLVVIWLARG
jgi:protein-S-isoprenylcysteine O-methyltransferase Ste14